MLTVGGNLYLERIRKGISQAELSRRTGIAQANLSNIENGKKDITVLTLLQICAALAVKPSSVLDAAMASPPRPRLSRTRLERISASVVGNLRPPSKEDREIVRLLRKNMGLGRTRRISSKEANLHWADLRRRLTNEEIESLRQRVEDALQRSKNAKKSY
jgi:transcriptional regulator with XRE-family HTH domain